MKLKTSYLKHILHEHTQQPLLCWKYNYITSSSPGDSLLFAAGAICGMGKLAILPLLLLLNIAAITGDALNYTIGNFLGTKAEQSNLLPASYFDRARQFYAKYGGKAIVLARFVPILRTFVPFVAGAGKM